MKLNSATQLTYCTNIHPGKDWPTTLGALQQYVPEIQSMVCPDKAMGMGLRLSNLASLELLEGEELEDFKAWLEIQDLYVFTMNGFPYGEFHGTRVKDKVHHPDWTSPDRLAYTLRLFNILSELLPADMEGGISTSPLSYKYWHNTEKAKTSCIEASCHNLAEVIKFLKLLEDSSGIYLHLDIEPEPDGLLENSGDVIHFFRQYAFPIISPLLQKSFGLSKDNAESLIRRYLNICYDACHYALAYEEPISTFKTMEDLGLRIGKIQLSSALRAQFNGNAHEEVWKALAKFREPVYLHQVTQKDDKEVKTYADLDEVLEARPSASELRAHFHVPLFLEKFEALSTTQEHLKNVLSALNGKEVTRHLEIETYTWDVFPEELKTSLVASVAEEYKWVLRNFGGDE